MKGKLLFVAGLAAGYVIGARAGRPAYEAIVRRVDHAASDPRVQDVVQKAKAELGQAAPAVAGAVAAVGGAVSAAKDAGAPPAPAQAAPPAPAAPDTGAVPGGADEPSTPTASD